MKDYEKDPIKEALKDPEVKKSVDAKAEKAPKEGKCISDGCDKPVAVGQNFVCTEHIRST